MGLVRMHCSDLVAAAKAGKVSRAVGAEAEMARQVLLAEMAARTLKSVTRRLYRIHSTEVVSQSSHSAPPSVQIALTPRSCSCFVSAQTLEVLLRCLATSLSSSRDDHFWPGEAPSSTRLVSRKKECDSHGCCLVPRAALLDLMNAKFRVPSGPQVGAPHIDVVTGPCLFTLDELALNAHQLVVWCCCAQRRTWTS